MLIATELGMTKCQRISATKDGVHVQSKEKRALSDDRGWLGDNGERLLIVLETWSNVHNLLERTSYADERTHFDFER